MTTAPQTTFGVKQIMGMLRCSRDFVINSIAAGRLKATRLASAGPNSVSQSSRYIVARDDLIRWLLTGQYDPHVLRTIINRSAPADAVLVRTRPSLHSAMLRRFPAVAVDSLFSLGKAMHERQTWAAVVDLNEVGAAEATRSLAAIARCHDRPELIGLVDGDYTPRPETAEVFDLLLPLSRSDESLARAVAELRP